MEGFQGLVQVRQVQKWQLAQKENLQILNLQIFAALLIHLLTTTTNFDKLFLKFFFFAATADVYRNEGNEAFKKGDFIRAIHFYSEGIKMNCNEKELKAKLYNNRAIAHFKLGKMILTDLYQSALKYS